MQLALGLLKAKGRECCLNIYLPLSPFNDYCRGNHEETHLARHPEKHQQNHLERVRGTIEKNKRGFGFINFDSNKFEDLFVPRETADQYFHGDRLELLIDVQGRVHEITLIEHRFKEIVGQYQSGTIIYERRNAYEAIPLKTTVKDLRPGEWIRATLQFSEGEAKRPQAIYVERFGESFPPDIDIKMIAAEYNLFAEPSPEAVAQADTLKLDITEALKGGRKDHRTVPLITIDGETARDFDDAVYVERTKTGFILWVSIADVSYYVTPDTPLDKDAFARATSVYFPERAFHMLPSNLSENLCSLRPKEPRLALTAILEFDHAGTKTKTTITESLIESKRRATYEEIHAEMLANKGNRNWEFAPHFELYEILKKLRTQRGSIDFEFPESQILVDKQGEPTEIKMLTRHDSHRLIEEFMIAANESVTEWALEKKWPFIYRIHETPTRQGLEKFEKIAATVGHPVRIDEDAVSPKLIAELARQFKDHPAKALLNMGLLRAMKQAVYSSEHDIHFGLASEGYTHFTSPIRRYPDLIVHRLLKEALYKEAKDLNFKKMKLRLADQAAHCSYRERLADSAERDMDRLKQVRFMVKRLGEVYEGQIIGMNERGIFMQLTEPFVEGFLPKEALADDIYEFNEGKFFFFGRSARKLYKIGDRFEVQVNRVSLERREIEFGLPGVEPLKKAPEGPRGGKERPRGGPAGFNSRPRPQGRDGGRRSGAGPRPIGRAGPRPVGGTGPRPVGRDDHPARGRKPGEKKSTKTRGRSKRSRRDR